MESFLQDFRFALRTLRKTKSVTLLASGSLALAIAGNAIVFSLVNALLYRPLPYPEPERLALLGENEKGSAVNDFAPASAANYLDWRERQTVFEELAAYRPTPVTLGSERPEPLSAAAVSPAFFELLGVRAARGRLFAPDDSGRPVAVASHDFWQSELAGDADVVGRTVVLDGETWTLVGVLPAGFEFLIAPRTPLWLPLDVDRASADRQRRDLFAVGRLAPGVTDARAKEEMTAIAARLEEEHPAANRGYGVAVWNLRHDIPDPRNRQLFGLLQGALVFVLLIACANVANLLLARAQAREREIAVRASLGAGRLRIVRQLLVESLAMALLAGVAGLALATFGVRAMAAGFGAQLPSFYRPVIDGRVLAFTLAVTLLGALLFGLAPALQTFRLDAVAALKEGVRGSSVGGRRRRLARALVVAEIALALVLLAGAGVLIESLDALRRTDSGFSTANLLTAQVALPEARYADDAAAAVAAEALVERLGSLPGVTATTASNALPRSPFVTADTFVVDARPPAADEAPPRATQLLAGPGYFATLGIELRAGRLLAAGDRGDAEPVVVVNAALAERFFPAGDALGATVTVRGRSRRVVGVVESVRHGFVLAEGTSPAIYLPLAQQPPRNLVLALRTAVAPQTLADAVRREVAAFDAGLAVARVESLDAILEEVFAGNRMVSAILAGFGVLALVLAALGTYGVLAYAVSQRTQEIGIRMAIGASRGSVLKMVTWQGLRMALLGLALGLPGVILVTRSIAGLLSGIVPVQPLAVASVALVLVAVTAAASVLPARRAASVDPIQALRAE